MKTWEYIAAVLAGIGALNWGLVGFFKFNLVEFALGWQTMLAMLIGPVYILVGLSGAYALYKAFK
jgi:uncharacterized membrane protein YuzA (DUF378 family)